MGQLAAMMKASDGLIEQANVDLHNRPTVPNADGKISTVRSIGIEADGRYINIPTVHPKGYIMTDDEAVSRYRQTGEHLGVYRSRRARDNAAIRLHDSQAKEYRN